MEKTPNTITNENRKNVVDPNHAKFRASELKVLLIINIHNLDDERYAIVARDFGYAEIIYIVDRIVKPKYFDENINKIRTEGIHYFKTIETAFTYDRQASFVDNNSTVRFWHDNGCLEIEFHYADNEIKGLYKEWYNNGQLMTENEYVNGSINGIMRGWHKGNGQLQFECEYINGKLNGIYRDWHSNGKLYCSCTYVDGLIEGMYMKWNNDGVLVSACNYVNNEKEGLFHDFLRTLGLINLFQKISTL